MMVLLLIPVSFALAVLIGRRYYRSSVWDWIHVVYYLLAIAFIVLVFASRDVQRQFLEVRRNLLSNRIRTHRLEEDRLGGPKLRLIQERDRDSSGLARIHGIVDLAYACRNPAFLRDPLGSDSVLARLARSEDMCLAASHYLPSLLDFKEKTREDERPGELMVDRLHATCNAAATMFADLGRRGLVSRPVVEGMVSTYEALREKGADPARFDEEVLPAIQAHLKKSGASRRQPGPELSPQTRRNLEVMSSEAEISGTILAGLFPCVAFAPAEFESLRTAMHKGVIYEARRLRLDSLWKISRGRRDSVIVHPSIAGLRLNLWFIFLLLALSLKLAKVAATMRRERVR